MLKCRGTELYPQRILSSTFFLSGLLYVISYLLNLAFLNKHTCYFSLNFNSKGKTLITFKLYYQKRTLPCPLRLRRNSQTNDQYKIERQNIDGSSLAMKSLWRLVWAMRHQSFHQFFCFWCSILKKLGERSNTSDYFSSISIYLRRFHTT